MKQIIEFSSLEEVERNMYLEDTWCNECSEADLGIVNPEMYIEDDRKFISGNCKSCGTQCISEIIVKIIE